MKIKGGKIELSEKEIRRQICSFLKQMGIKWWYNLQGLGAYKGLPDLEGVYHRDIFPGKHFYIEIKRSKGVLSEHQERFKKMVEQAGEDYLTAHSLDEFLEWWQKTFNKER